MVEKFEMVGMVEMVEMVEIKNIKLHMVADVKFQAIEKNRSRKHDHDQVILAGSLSSVCGCDFGD